MWRFAKDSVHDSGFNTLLSIKTNTRNRTSRHACCHQQQSSTFRKTHKQETVAKKSHNWNSRGRCQRRDQWCPSPHLKSVSPHLMFDSQVAPYIHNSIKNNVGPIVIFGYPCRKSWRGVWNFNTLFLEVSFWFYYFVDLIFQAKWYFS